MLLYCNNNLIKKDYDIESEYYDNFIYSNDGIYKKYKKHFYMLDICNNIKSVNNNNFNFFIQETDHVINKNKLITYIPYNHYYVSRKTIKYKIDEDIYYVKEIDNDVYVNEYFILNHIDNIETLCLLLDNNI
tara:strand:+ start:5097 stop:5492 length:396 start_codon:yes stop_codon:yes gene_type:complete